ncbi:hypothetical protein ACIBEJ_51505 [Nonomuraea sp. NPDC050790]|uniref:hypothetical protein n=1 Tax=Nonomuraea sp. NPDC050790 TaxID=3364371 RepID=UPI003792901E
MITQSPSTGLTFLRRVLGLDAAVTAVNGLAYVAAGELIGKVLGPDATTLRWPGVFLMIYGAAVAFLAAHPRPAGVVTVVTVNGVWAVGSIVAIPAGLLNLTALGVAWTLAQAAVVAVFAVLQVAGLRRVN